MLFFILEENPLKIMSNNVLKKIINFNQNKTSFNLKERKDLIDSFRFELEKKLIKSGDVLEDIIDHLNND